MFAALDVFSRYPFLFPLSKKDPAELQVSYWFLNDEKSSEYPFIPAVLQTFPDDITPSMCGFETKDI